MADTGMTIVQFAILRNLSRMGSAPLSRLAEVLVMDRTSLYRALDPLTARGWIAIADGTGRAKLATVTDKGEQAKADATGAWERAQAALLAGFGAEPWRAMEQSLRHLSALAGKVA